MVPSLPTNRRVENRVRSKTTKIPACISSDGKQSQKAYRDCCAEDCRRFDPSCSHVSVDKVRDAPWKAAHQRLARFGISAKTIVQKCSCGAGCCLAAPTERLALPGKNQPRTQLRSFGLGLVRCLQSCLKPARGGRYVRMKLRANIRPVLQMWEIKPCRWIISQYCLFLAWPRSASCSRSFWDAIASESSRQLPLATEHCFGNEVVSCSS